MEVLRRWNEDGANYVEFYFTGMRGPPPQRVRVYALYAAPAGGQEPAGEDGPEPADGDGPEPADGDGPEPAGEGGEARAPEPQ